MKENSDFSKASSYALYVSQLHDCAYLPGQEARTLFLDPAARVDSQIYQLLIDRGFRRSGQYLYQPACPQCEACVSLRFPVAEFKPNRSQRRNWNKNRERIQVIAKPAQFSQEHFSLYRKYQTQRHVDGAMACSEPETYMKFLSCDWAETVFYEFRQAQRLVAVAVTDLLPNGISSVYTFFDPDLRAEGLGIFALLWQIRHAFKLDKLWVYPGFWIEGSNKMNYKSRYRPLEAWNGKNWGRYNDKEPLLL